MIIYGSIAEKLFIGLKVTKVNFDETHVYGTNKFRSPYAIGRLPIDITEKYFTIYQVPFTAYRSRDGEFVIDIHCPSNYQNLKKVLNIIKLTPSKYHIIRKGEKK